MHALANLIDTIIELYIGCLFVFVIMSWMVNFGVLNTNNRFVYLVMDFLYRITEPPLRPIRRFLPNFGSIDLSPIVLVLILIFIRNFINVDLQQM